MKDPTLVKILSAAPSVATNAQDYTPWRYIKEHTLVLNCSDFHSVTTNAQHQVIWQSMEELTTVINHLAASSVINPQHQQGQSLKVAGLNLNPSVFCGTLFVFPRDNPQQNNVSFLAPVSDSVFLLFQMVTSILLRMVAHSTTIWLLETIPTAYQRALCWWFLKLSWREKERSYEREKTETETAVKSDTTFCCLLEKQTEKHI